MKHYIVFISHFNSHKRTHPNILIEYHFKYLARICTLLHYFIKVRYTLLFLFKANVCLTEFVTLTKNCCTKCVFCSNATIPEKKHVIFISSAIIVIAVKLGTFSGFVVLIYKDSQRGF